MEKERLQMTSLVFIAAVVISLLFFYDNFNGYKIEFADNNISSVTTDEFYQEENSINNELTNINTATKEELMEVEGIGEVLAERILEYILNNGNIASFEQLQNVEGVGDTLIERISEQFYVQ